MPRSWPLCLLISLSFALAGFAFAQPGWAPPALAASLALSQSDLSPAKALAFAESQPQTPQANPALALALESPDDTIRLRAADLLLPQPASPWQAKTLLVKADSLPQAEAKPLLEQIVQHHPSEPEASEALLRLAELALVSRQPKLAETLATELLEKYPLCPELYEARLLIAQAAADQGNLDLALRLLKALIKLAPDSLASLEAANRANELAPDTYAVEGRFRCHEAEEHLALARSVFEQGDDYQTAAEGFRRFIEFYPTSEYCPEALELLAKSLEAAGAFYTPGLALPRLETIVFVDSSDTDRDQLVKQQELSRGKLNELDTASKAWLELALRYPGSGFQLEAVMGLCRSALAGGDPTPLLTFASLVKQQAPNSPQMREVEKLLGRWALSNAYKPEACPAGVLVVAPEAFRQQAWLAEALSTPALGLAPGEVASLLAGSPSELQVGGSLLTGPAGALALLGQAGLDQRLAGLLPAELKASLELAPLAQPGSGALLEAIDPASIARRLFYRQLEVALRLSPRSGAAEPLAEGLAWWLALATTGQAFGQEISTLPGQAEQLAAEFELACAPFEALGGEVALGLWIRALGSPFAAEASLPGKLLAEIARREQASNPTEALFQAASAASGRQVETSFEPLALPY